MRILLPFLAQAERTVMSDTYAIKNVESCVRFADILISI